MGDTPIPMAYEPMVLAQEQAEELVGHPLPSQLFEWVPIGHRLVVVVEPPKQQIGRIHVPKSAQKRPARGWVVAAGELVGTRWSPSGEATGWWPLSPPDTVLGARVIFGAYAGRSLLIDPTEDHRTALKEWFDQNVSGVSFADAMDEFLSPFKLLTDNDIWAFYGPDFFNPTTTEETQP